MYQVIFYQTRRGDYPVKDFIDTLDKKTRAKVYQYLKLLEREGPKLIRPYANHVKGKVRELRVRFAKTHIRILYFFFDNRIVLLHGFKKKTKEVPIKEIEQAEQNMEDWILRYERR